MAQQAVLAGAELVIAAGGDGTLHAVASGVINTNSALGILPMGTMNNIARSLKIPEDIEQACEIIATGETSRIDVGKNNDSIFLEVAGAGLEAALFPAAEEL
jgi:diacylglycerol kinase family enzyme